MKGFAQHPARVTFRLLWLLGEIVIALLDFVINVMFQTKVPLPQARAQWLQHACRRVLRIMDVKIQTKGPIPVRGLMVSNHLSYVDILLISAITPSVFIAKNEVKRWPVFGWFAQLSGTLFVRRSRRSDVARLNRELHQLLDTNLLVVLFPEGTSSDGSQVLPFKSSLLEPITRLDQPVTVAFIQYSLPEGNAGEDVCYWGDMTLAPHLLNLFSKEGVTAHVSFTRLEHAAHSRKELARSLHSHVLRLKEAGAEPALLST
ncbi:MAG TPA: lysophospholipid acyltransferase family protein [Candidatus Saccharimonadales bacterium]|nr:lysophospholipid acyltransferase family protein [Candidatus Saccharimonadales bacterium]